MNIAETNTRQIKIGLFGFGVVGRGFYDVLKKTPLTAEILKVCVKDTTKERKINDLIFTSDANDILNDPDINVVVELIDDADAALYIVTEALKRGKAVVSANKRMIAGNFHLLKEMQKKYNTPLLYEGSCCAGIPVIRNLEEYYDNDSLTSVKGIVNGSTNYILTQVNNGISFQQALISAIQSGFAESNPVLDVEGHDAVNKLIILAAHSFGVELNACNILSKGIAEISETDAGYAREKNCRIKLIAHAKKLPGNRLTAFVLPTFVNISDDLYNVNEEFNGIIIESNFADKHFFKGKGAGAIPTAAAVLSDISALRYSYKYEYKKLSGRIKKPVISNDHYLKIFVSYKTEEIPVNDFEWIDQSYEAATHNWLTGVINAEKLLKSDWWRHPEISLILINTEEESRISYNKIKKRSLSLAGL